MSTEDAYARFAKGLESQIKSTLRDVIEDEGELEIGADFRTKIEIDDALGKFGLTVHGMYVSEDEFAVFFEFNDTYRDIDGEVKPYKCRINLNNDGEYIFFLQDSHFDDDWHLSVMDENGTYFSEHINSGKLRQNNIDELNNVLFLKIISN